MTYAQALTALKSGKRVTRPHWDTHLYLHPDRGVRFRLPEAVKRDVGDEYLEHGPDLAAKDWEIVR